MRGLVANHDPAYSGGLWLGGRSLRRKKGANGIRMRRNTRNFAQMNLTTAKPLGGVAGDARGAICDAGDVWLHVPKKLTKCAFRPWKH